MAFRHASHLLSWNKSPCKPIDLMPVHKVTKNKLIILIVCDTLLNLSLQPHVCYDFVNPPVKIVYLMREVVTVGLP